MNNLVWIVILLVGAGFLWAGFVFSKERFPPFLRETTLTGWEVFLLGFVIGPGGFGLIGAGELNQLDPFIALGLGWAGLIFGIQLRWADLKKVEPFIRFLTVGQTLAAGMGLCLVFLFMGVVFHGYSASGLAAAALLVGAACSVSSPTAISIMAARLPKTSLPLIRPLLVVSTLDLAPALAVVGLLFCFFDPMNESVFSMNRGVALATYSIVIAILLAAMFLLIDRKKLSGEHNLAVFMGFIIFASGISFYLGLSPLFTNLLTGIILANVLSPDDSIHTLLHATEKPFYVILLVVAGLWWTAEGAGVWITGIALAAARVELKYHSVKALERFWTDGQKLPPNAGLALCSPGAMSLAMGLNFLLAYHGDGPVFAFGAIAVSTMIGEAMAPALIRRALARGEENERA